MPVAIENQEVVEAGRRLVNLKVMIYPHLYLQRGAAPLFIPKYAFIKAECLSSQLNHHVPA